MDQQAPVDLRERVIKELERRTGEMTKIARESGVAYDTVQRIKYRQGDPSYGKIRKLADYFGFDVDASSTGADESSSASVPG